VIRQRSEEYRGFMTISAYIKVYGIIPKCNNGNVIYTRNIEGFLKLSQ
jgi:hypothetical protein